MQQQKPSEAKIWRYRGYSDDRLIKTDKEMHTDTRYSQAKTKKDHKIIICRERRLLESARNAKKHITLTRFRLLNP